jgi:hypothetical protein
MGNRVVKLKKILWADFILGFITAVILAIYKPLAIFLGLPADLLLMIAAVTFLYSLLAFYLAMQAIPSGRLVRILVIANWAWTVVSVILLMLFIAEATIFGVVFLVLQVVVVGGLAWLEGREPKKIY